MEKGVSAEKISFNGDLRGEQQQQAIRTVLEEKWASGTDNFHIDMSGVTNIDFDSLSEILTIRNKFSQTGAPVMIENIPKRIRKVMELFRVALSED